MTGPAASTVTAADWDDWLRRGVSVVDDGIELPDGAGRRAGSTEGTIVGRFDAGTTEFQWDRLRLERAVAAPDANLTVRYRAGDACSLKDGGIDVEKTTVSALSSAGIETCWELATGDLETVSSAIPEHRVAGALRETAREAIESATSTWTAAETDSPEDVRLSAARGRYLSVALRIVGSAENSPRVEAVDVYGPRRSSVRHLPAIYQREGFLERFLSIFEQSFEDLDERRAALTALLDPHGVPADALPWLESWLGIDADPAWPESARRERLARHAELSRRRGTKAGLLATIDLYLRHAQDTTAQAFCVESVDVDVIEDGAARAAWDFRESEQWFVVFAGPFDSERHRAAIDRIVENESPAHVDGVVRPIGDGVELGVTGFLGIDSRLTERQFRLDDTALDREATLTGQANQASEIR